MEAGSIASWNINEGGSFAAGDVLCEIETDKATVSFEAQDDGVIARILAQAGPDEIKCGVPILITVEDEEHAGAFKDYVVDTAASSSSSVPSSPEPDAAASPPLEAPVEVPSPAVVPPDQTAVSGGGATAATLEGGKVVASPLAWTVAKEKGLDLSSIAIVGTGPDGRIVADDVREYIPMAATGATAPAGAAATAAGSPTPLSPTVSESYTDVPQSDAMIAAANLLSYSKQTIPHYYLTVDVTLDALISLRDSLNAALGEKAPQISLNDLLIKAAACAMKSCPSANASWMGDSVRMYDNVDVNVVMGNGDSLYSPVLHNVGSRGLKSISEELSMNLKNIEEGTVQGDNFAAVGTVTFMNLGPYGVKSCAPIIRAPQAVALALGAAENRIVPKEDGEGDDIYETKVLLTATLSCDHRVVDGAVGAQYLSAFKAAIETPEMLLL
jgi:Pyruvate/2-oxoglutarate dehydrogenase complex, dihydrolipoamide acyltransferase (E2) component, and related enzymes